MISTSVDRLRRFASRATDHSSCDLCRSELTDRHRHVLEVAHRRLLCACDACALLFSDADGSRFRPIPQSVTRIEMKLSDAQWSGLSIPIGMAFFTVQEPQDISTHHPPSGRVERQQGEGQRPASTYLLNNVGPAKTTIGLPARSSRPSRREGEVIKRYDAQAGEVAVDFAPVMVGYPSPAGPVMSSVEHEDWQALVAANPDVRRLRPEVESLLINRTENRRQAFVVPLDVCFELTGIVRRHWDGWSGGPKVHREIDCFFDQLDVSAGKGVSS